MERPDPALPLHSPGSVQPGTELKHGILGYPNMKHPEINLRDISIGIYVTPTPQPRPRGRGERGDREILLLKEQNFTIPSEFFPFPFREGAGDGLKLPQHTSEH
jgi:hypothetical protein